MAKPFKTIEEQIDLLKKRNLCFNDEEKAKDYLLKNNYYNVINCYSKFLMDKPDHYVDGSYFEQIIDIQRLDREIKDVVLKNMLVIENYIKSIVSYYFCKAYPGRYSYLIQSNYNLANIPSVTKITNDLNDIILTNSKQQNNAVKHYTSQHNDVPLWVLVNFTTFGQINNVYRNLQSSVKNDIVKEFNRIFNDNIGTGTSIRLTDVNVDTIFDNLKNTRNVLAHDNKLFFFSLRNHYKFIPEIHAPLGISRLDQRNNFYNTFLIMKLFLSKEQYQLLNNSIRKRMKKLYAHCGIDITNAVIDAYGFPKDWFMLPAI